MPSLCGIPVYTVGMLIAFGGEVKGRPRSWPPVERGSSSSSSNVLRALARPLLLSKLGLQVYKLACGPLYDLVKASKASRRFRAERCVAQRAQRSVQNRGNLRHAPLRVLPSSSRHALQGLRGPSRYFAGTSERFVVAAAALSGVADARRR
mmetsp:Transcript_13985/g.52230  ORF Transcript_13985/g.52230 Transcript_13985/m.52230 type:complete len:151 (+) Transcript_13985:1471-1923(+)